MVALPRNGFRQSILVFAIVLILSGFVFAAYNRQLHIRTDKAEYEACVKDAQIAANQRRVIGALLALAADHPHLDTRSTELAGLARARVPKFDCQK